MEGKALVQRTEGVNGAIGEFFAVLGFMNDGT